MLFYIFDCIWCTYLHVSLLFKYGEGYCVCVSVCLCLCLIKDSWGQFPHYLSGQYLWLRTGAVKLSRCLPFLCVSNEKQKYGVLLELSLVFNSLVLENMPRRGQGSKIVADQWYHIPPWAPQFCSCEMGCFDVVALQSYLPCNFNLISFRTCYKLWLPWSSLFMCMWWCNIFEISILGWQHPLIS